MSPHVRRSAILAALVFLPCASLEAQLSPNQAVVNMALPEHVISTGRMHRAMIPTGHPAMNVIASMNAAVAIEDYGSFSMVVIDESALGGHAAVEALQSTGVDVRDELSMVNVNGYVQDGADPAATARMRATMPLSLRDDLTPPADDQRRLRIVQFTGPVKDAWLDALRATGAHVISYLPNDAYAVSAGPLAFAQLATFATQPYVLAVSPYEPAMKLRPELRPPFASRDGVYKVTVQVIADAEADAFAASLATRAIEVVTAPNAVAGYVNVALTVNGDVMFELARDHHVFAIEPVLTPKLLDEAQGQIMAGNLNAAGTQPTGAGYLAWLGGKGFPGAGQDPFDFVVDVTDDGIDKGDTVNVNSEFKVDGQAAGASRVAYVFNYSGDALADGRAGHGNINASIISGYNALTGSAFEDASGYNYGLGIAPWVKVGNSKVFSNAGAGVFNQPTLTRMQNAYNAGARISSNSWGFTSGTTYNTDSQAHDQAVRDAASGTAGNQELTIVFAAGNSGSGASTVHPPGTAKNIITVGAEENFRMTGTDGCGVANSGADSAQDIISFSSRGPTSDSRKKPEIMAPGTHIEGAASLATGYDGTGVCNQFWPTGQTLYAWSSGTSHSTPAISGAAALVRRYWGLTGLGTPSPAMVKTELMNGTNYMNGVGANDTLPSNNQGMGSVNLGRTFDSAARIRVDQSQVLGATGATHTVTGSVADTSKPFRVTLAWTDAPGPTTGNAFVNDLNLTVTVNGTTYLGNVFSGANSITGGAADTRNNVESVYLPAGTSGSFTVTVTAANISGDGVPGNADTTDQDFAPLVYNGNAGAPSPDFSISATPASQTITQGGSTNFTVNTAALNGFAGNITLSATPAISGVTYSFAPNPVAAGASSTLTVTSTAGATTGTTGLTINGTSGALSHNAGVSLTINPTGGGGNPVKTFSAAPNSAIPDNNATGTTSTINVADSLTISSISVSTVITHTYKGDLTVSLIGPDNTTVLLHNRTGGSTDNVTTTFSIATAAAQALSAFNGKNTAGAWKLKVADLAAVDTGTLNSWKITFNGEKATSAGLAIPDNNATGVTSTATYTQTGTVADVKVSVNITHTFKGDLTVSLIAPDNTTVILHNKTGGSTDNVITEYPDLTAPAQALSAFTGKSIAGGWKLKVVDSAAADTGTLVSWTLSLTAQ